MPFFAKLGGFSGFQEQFRQVINASVAQHRDVMLGEMNAFAGVMPAHQVAYRAKTHAGIVVIPPHISKKKLE